MPELPEVETIKETLRPQLRGRVITGAELRLPRLLKIPEPDVFITLLKDKEIRDLSRRGKYLLVHLSDSHHLVFHLGMTGQLLYFPGNAPICKHTHLIFDLHNEHQLCFRDMRTFGKVYLVAVNELNLIRGLSTLGPEPLGPKFTPAYLTKALSGRRAAIKAILLNQKVLAGLGNIYGDESLFKAGIHPTRRASSLAGDEILSLHRAIGEVLTAGIRHRGTSFRDYVDGEGKGGHFQEHLAVYGRHQKPCLRCGTSLERTRVVGRSSVYCPRCQPL